MNNGKIQRSGTSEDMQKIGQLWSQEDREKLKNIIQENKEKINYEELTIEFQRNIKGIQSRCEILCKELIEENNLTKEEAISRCQLSENFIQKLEEKVKQKDPEYLQEEKEKLREIILNSEENLDYEELSKELSRSIRDTKQKCKIICKELIKNEQLTEQQAIEKCQLELDFMKRKSKSNQKETSYSAEQKKEKQLEKKQELIQQVVKSQQQKIAIVEEKLEQMQKLIKQLNEKVVIIEQNLKEES